MHYVRWAMLSVSRSRSHGLLFSKPRGSCCKFCLEFWVFCQDPDTETKTITSASLHIFYIGSGFGLTLLLLMLILPPDIHTRALVFRFGAAPWCPAISCPVPFLATIAAHVGLLATCTSQLQIDTKSSCASTLLRLSLAIAMLFLGNYRLSSVRVSTF